MEEPPRPPPVTPSSVAKSYFERDLKAHPGKNTDVVVILHDACYGHRYSRPRTSKAALSTIVERPERIIATVLGVSAAYVLLGGRHSDGPHGPHPTGPLAPIPFRIHKSSRIVSLTSSVVTQVHGLKWMAELKMMCEGAEAKLAMNGKELVRPTGQTTDGGEVKPKLHEGDLYLCAESLDALEGALGGVLDAVDTVFSSNGSKRAFVCIRPPGHHCSDNYPSGFCWLNNVHVGISHASTAHGLTHAAIIDFDLHHGDGSQTITWAHNAKVTNAPKNTPIAKRTAIGYFSLHDINSYPCEYGDEEKVQNASLCIENAHGQTIWNVHLQPWRTDSEFWELYENRYSILIEKTRQFLRVHRDRLRALNNPVQPKAAIFISAGFDASEWESHGMQRHKLNVPTDFYARFTRDIVDLSNEEGLGVDGRVISVLEGGYSDRALASGVLSHLGGLAGSKSTPDISSSHEGLAYEMGRRLGQLSINGASNGHSLPIPFDTRWWSPTRLEELEAVVNPPSMMPVPKKPRGPINPTYTTPTQSFAAKIVSPSAARRSVSGSIPQRSPSAANSRPPSPPPPEVEWTIASHELSKLLIPSDRRTNSCKPEDLNAEATKVRRSRQSMVAVQSDVVAEPGKRMQLRDRKTKAPAIHTTEEVEARPASRTNRRRTLGDAASLEKYDGISHDGPPKATPASRRRVSVASTVISMTDEPEQHSGQMAAEVARRPSSSGQSIPVILSNSYAAGPSLVEKARPSATTSRSSSKSGASRKAPIKPPIPRAPSASARLPKSIEAQPINEMPHVSSNVPGAVDPSNQPDVDSLVSGVKKMSIKLKVPPKAEYVAREAKKKPATRAPKKAATASTTKAVKTSASRQPTAIRNESKLQSEQRAHVAGNLSALSPPPDTTEAATRAKEPKTNALGESSTNGVRLPASFMAPESGTTPAPVLAAPVPDVSQTVDVTSMGMANVQPPKSPTSKLAATAGQPLSPGRSRSELPVFTSTSPITFSLAQGTSFPPPAAKPLVAPGAATGASDAGQTAAQPEVKKEEVSRKPVDVWNVPDTPQRT